MTTEKGYRCSLLGILLSTFWGAWEVRVLLVVVPINEPEVKSKQRLDSLSGIPGGHLLTSTLRDQAQTPVRYGVRCLLRLLEIWRATNVAHTTVAVRLSF